MCDEKEKLKILTSLALNNDLSKSEMNILYYCWFEERTSKDIAEHFKWQSPNVSRSLLQMYHKKLLSRILLDDKRTYKYKSNLDLNSNKS
ncbi:hypothetical protein [Enterococcus sp. AZ180]|uniref:hypothetical protein n=1 Tax=Enterococcus sp. AZ180 TaxID=2774961 RepID=UPI003F1F7B84